MSTHDIGTAQPQPVDDATRDGLLAPFIAATQTALGEMAGTEVAVRAMYRSTRIDAPADIRVALKLASASTQLMILAFPEATATSLAWRMLAGTNDAIDDPLIRDCAGETANVIAGQAKALLAETPRRFTFSVPEIVADTDRLEAPSGMAFLVVTFTTELGPFTLVLGQTGSVATDH